MSRLRGWKEEEEAEAEGHLQRRPWETPTLPNDDLWEGGKKKEKEEGREEEEPVCVNRRSSSSLSLSLSNEVPPPLPFLDTVHAFISRLSFYELLMICGGTVKEEEEKRKKN